MMIFSGLFRISTICAIFTLAGCTSETGPFQPILTATGLAPKQVEAKDFVKASRPDADKIEYMPIGFEAKSHATKVRSPAEIEADDKALRAAAAQANAQGHVKVPANPSKTSPSKTSPKKKRIIEDDPNSPPPQN